MIAIFFNLKNIFLLHNQNLFFCFVNKSVNYLNEMINSLLFAKYMKNKSLMDFIVVDFSQKKMSIKFVFTFIIFKRIFLQTSKKKKTLMDFCTLQNIKEMMCISCLSNSKSNAIIRPLSIMFFPQANLLLDIPIVFYVCSLKSRLYSN